MERIQIVERPSLGECEQPQCSLNAINLCTTHRKKVWNECSAIFHYGWNLKISNGEDFIKVAKDAIDYLVQDIYDEGIKYRINRDYPEFDDWMKDLKGKANEFRK